METNQLFKEIIKFAASVDALKMTVQAQNIMDQVGYKTEGPALAFIKISLENIVREGEILLKETDSNWGPEPHPSDSLIKLKNI